VLTLRRNLNRRAFVFFLQVGETIEFFKPKMTLLSSLDEEGEDFDALHFLRYCTPTFTPFASFQCPIFQFRRLQTVVVLDVPGAECEPPRVRRSLLLAGRLPGESFVKRKSGPGQTMKEQSLKNGCL